MIEKIKQRGTSRPGICKGPSGTLGASGISLVNENPGPAVTPSGDRAIVMDGSVVNVQELLGLLEVHQLEDETDAEVTLHAYEDLGSRLFDILEDHANQVISDDEFNAERDLSKDFRVRSKEELLYYRKFKRFFLGIKYRWLRLVVRSMDKWFSLASKTDWRRH